MPISKKLRAEFIMLGTELAPTYTQASVVTRNFTISLNQVDLENCAPFERWKRLFDYVENNAAIQQLIEGIKDIYTKDTKIIELEKSLKDEQPEKVINDLKGIIASGNCVLFLGPEILKARTDDEIIPFNRKLSDEFVLELDRKKVYYDQDQKQNLSYLIDRFESADKRIGRTENFSKEIYDECQIDDRLFTLIEQLNFPLIINTNPDTQLADLFGRKRFPTTYYNFSNYTTPQIEKISGSPGITQVYNIYGSFENPYSIVFTEKDSVEFARKSYEQNPLIPAAVVETVNRCYGFFIGFDFKDWHLKILFDVLNLKNKPPNYSITGINNNYPEYLKEYFERVYDMKFIKNDIGTILKKLK